MKDIKVVGFNIAFPKENQIYIKSYTSISDLDIVVFSPQIKFFAESRQDGKNIYKASDREDFIKYNKHWMTEITNLLKLGKGVFIILPKIEEFIFYTGKVEYRGTSKNAPKSYHVAKASNYDLLKITELLGVSYVTAKTKVTKNKNNIFYNFYNQLGAFMDSEVYINNDKEKEINMDVIFYDKNESRALGQIIYFEGGGYIVLLPNINIPTVNNSYENETRSWADEKERLSKFFIQEVHKIDRAIRQTEEKSTRPDWLKEDVFELKEINIINEKIAKQIKIISEAKKSILKFENDLKEEQVLQDLLFETGKQLELAVQKALIILGYEVEAYDDGELELDQVIISPEGLRLIGECEGKDNKDIDISKLRQLVDSLNAYNYREEVEETFLGLLIGNPQRLLPPNKRTLDFTKKCKDSADREKIGLIKTTDLFFVCRYIQEYQDIEFAEKCRESISNQLGSIIEFPIIPSQE